MTEASLFDRVGGTPFFERLVDRFYAGAETDPVLLAVYPDHADFAGARHRLTLFLVQYWGGPTTYSDERGHPRLRMRHAPFAIGSWSGIDGSSTCARRSTNSAGRRRPRRVHPT